MKRDILIGRTTRAITYGGRYLARKTYAFAQAPGTVALLDARRACWLWIPTTAALKGL